MRVKWEDTPGAIAWAEASRWGDRLRRYQEKREQERAKEAAKREEKAK